MNDNKKIPDSLEIMRKFSEVYAQRTGTFFCIDLSVTSVVIEGLAKHKDEYGLPLCPCRHYEDKVKEVSSAYWNCPCVPMRERKECHCMLFLKSSNEFASQGQQISFANIIKDIE
uniref:Ferredoxin-thioredoxin reductase, catalytic chain n=1 Tax=Ceramothamnion japonicum TaxID=218448 RepID=A0A1C9CDB3_CERJP|nr:ferredoxin-thioredoxin reductase beta subunit [Ceramium japonicum]AOM66370.1 ferredoxin-thioredoxin reductase beta subunit [Ceramium japonicum]